MKKVIFAVALMLGVAFNAKAGEQPVFDVAYSTFAIQSVLITSNTPVLINSRPSGFAANIGKVRIVNPHPSWNIWVGDVNVSTDSVNKAGLGGELIPANGGKAEWQIYKDYRRNGNPTPIYAKAADSAAVDRLPALSVIFFGY